MRDVGLKAGQGDAAVVIVVVDAAVAVVLFVVKVLVSTSDILFIYKRRDCEKE